jgi:hypothetical protein
MFGMTAAPRGSPPAPELTAPGRVDPKMATPSELRGENLFFGKAQRDT